LLVGIEEDILHGPGTILVAIKELVLELRESVDGRFSFNLVGDWYGVVDALNSSHDIFNI
jgi:hypothetical protein